MSAKVAAIEIADDEVRLAVVKTCGARPKVIELHACRVAHPIPEDAMPILPGDAANAPTEPADAATGQKADADQERKDALVQAVCTVVKRMRARPVTHVLCASSDHGIARLLTVPFRGKRRVAAAVRFELEPFLAFPIDELVVDFVTAQEVEGQTEVLAVGLRKSYLREQLAVLEVAGVETEGIALDGVGLTALWQSCSRRMKGLNAVLHVRERYAVFAIVNGKNLAYFRHIPVSASEVHENPVALARQVQNSIRAFEAGWRGEANVLGLTITGVDLFEEERVLIEAELEVPVRQENLFSRLRGARRAHRAAVRVCAEWRHTPQAEGTTGALEAPAALNPGYDAADKTNYWTGAIGAAMGAGGGPYSVDFRKEELAWPGLSRHLVGHLVFSCCLALMTLLGLAWYFHAECTRNLEEAELLQAQIEEVSSEIDGLREAGIGVSLDLFSDPSLLDVLGELGAKIPDSKARITELKIARSGSGDDWVTVAGEVTNEAVFAEVLADLRGSPLFRVEENPKYAMVGGKSTFTIRLMRPQTGENVPSEDSSNG